jgi:hypothetical protein
MMEDYTGGGIQLRDNALENADSSATEGDVKALSGGDENTAVIGKPANEQLAACGDDRADGKSEEATSVTSEQQPLLRETIEAPLLATSMMLPSDSYYLRFLILNAIGRTSWAVATLVPEPVVTKLTGSPVLTALR